MDGLDSDEDFMEEEEEYTEAEALGSLGNLMADEEEEGAPVPNEVKVQMSLDEYEEMKTNRQHNYEEQKKEKEMDVLASLAEEVEPVAAVAAPAGAPAAEAEAAGGEDSGKKGKKKGKKDKAVESDRGEGGEKKKTGGGMFKKRK